MPPLTNLTKNIIIINVLFFAASYVFKNSLGINLDDWLGLHYIQSSSFHVWQLLTYSFLHADVSHIFFNMFAVYMFGASIEYALGAKRFLIYYMVTAVGAALIQEVALYFDFRTFIEVVDSCFSETTTQSLQQFIQTYPPKNQATAEMSRQFINSYNAKCQIDFLSNYQAVYLSSSVTVGASGAVFALLLAFAMFYPDMRILVFFLIPMKAKWFVIIYGLIELFQGLGIQFQADHVAHWAHLGGLFFGFFPIRRWKKS